LSEDYHEDAGRGRSRTAAQTSALPFPIPLTTVQGRRKSLCHKGVPALKNVVGLPFCDIGFAVQRQFVSGFNEALTMAWRALAATVHPDAPREFYLC
ncbi:hypothetical protein O5853_29125, partial [Escherichia coli]|nr:hypothetical protein [Escherichia coli]